MKKIGLKEAIPFVLLASLAVAAIFVPSLPDFADEGKVYNSADIGWVLVATALVFLMTPGLAFFYGGMVHRKNVISTMIKSVVAAGVVSIIWVTVGYSLSFGDSLGGFIGDPSTHLFFKGVNSGEPWSAAPTIPKTLFALFQLMFAIITPGLVVGAVAERIRFTSYILFIALFSILVYAPLAHWSWHPKGFLAAMGALDFAGGTVVHISAGCAALAGAMVLKRRKTHMEGAEIPPANVPYVLIGTGLLWLGWFGFGWYLQGSFVLCDFLVECFLFGSSLSAEVLSVVCPTLFLVVCEGWLLLMRAVAFIPCYVFGVGVVGCDLLVTFGSFN
jgi:Amt family ammonium transporter